jgi:hypothetical protein
MPDAPEAIPSRPRVALRATAFFTLSFVMSANGNVLPQQFFQRHTPTQKALWLASCLLLGTATATLAVWRARRGRATRGPMLLTLGATLLAEAALFTLRHPVAYLILNAVAVFGANTLTNQVDLTASARAGAVRRGLHDAASNLARLLGILTAPWFFTRHVAPSRRCSCSRWPRGRSGVRCSVRCSASSADARDGPGGALARDPPTLSARRASSAG